MLDLYLTDSYRKEVDTKIKDICGIKKDKAISLLENIFYPAAEGSLKTKELSVSVNLLYPY